MASQGLGAADPVIQRADQRPAALLFDFGGTLDGAGLTWKTRAFRLYQAAGLAADPAVFLCLERSHLGTVALPPHAEPTPTGRAHAIARSGAKANSAARAVFMETSDVSYSGTARRKMFQLNYFASARRAAAAKRPDGKRAR